MKTITACIGGKTYTATAITTAAARETVRLMEELDAVSRATQALGAESGAAEISAVVRARLDCTERETALVCRVFGDRITPGEVEDSLTRAELDALTARISAAVGDLAARHTSAAAPSGTRQTASEAMDKLYHTLATALRWPIYQIDAADFESLLRFVFYRDPDRRIINGREYRRAAGVPTWL